MNIIHGGLYEYPESLDGGFSGADAAANTDSWDRATDDDNALGCEIDIVTGVVYGYDMKGTASTAALRSTAPAASARSARRRSTRSSRRRRRLLRRCASGSALMGASRTGMLGRCLRDSRRPARPLPD